MALTVKRITLWRREVANRPGVLASTLEPLAGAGADLQLVMGYRFPEAHERAAIEVFPVTGKKAAAAAEAAGLRAFELPCLLVEGDNRAGLGAAIGRAIAEAGVNVVFLVAQVFGRRFTAAIGLEDDAAVAAATRAIKSAARPTAKRRRR
jgi:predicted amino acid-binding ACT domain protein